MRLVSGVDLVRGFPTHTVKPGTALWRIHQRGLSPWYFRNDDLFRFDLKENPLHGTCYLSEEPLGAFVETLQGFRAVPLPRSELGGRRLFKVTLEHTLCLADLTSNSAAPFGLDASISASSGGDYIRSQEFARKAYEAGFGGIRYRVRHDLEQELTGVALFGPAGAQGSLKGLTSGVSKRIPENVVGEACERLGFVVRSPLLDS